ncbi:Si:dkey-194e6.1 [Caenorhabditis elegans]|uniref:Si:dkey-194e6.1 n=1 Tax=Caenorhabditis elegans TaxID=6239 RepID=G5ED49_CAEEL|nr:Si:dkey-194e6.1 [Caenorhabditis elegans]CAA21758.1 Si:dkey-194e6.1 [Caenorhabditis elegans]|eukprot:NP_506725.1 Uncharacterized protein CELE_Y75B12A.2 [Caenorhabditis elegans]
MCSYSLAPAIFCLFFIPMVSATGHLRLELTASSHFSLHLSTNSSLQIVELAMGSTRTLSFHPKDHQETLEIVFSKEFNFPLKYAYKMETDDSSYQTFAFTDIVLLVKSTFKCDAGFNGKSCQEKTTSTTTTTSTKTEIQTTTTTVLISEVPSTTPIINAAAFQQFDNSNTIMCSVLIIVTATLLVLVLIAFFLLKFQKKNVYIRPGTPNLEKCPMKLEDSGFSSPTSPRYTAEPHSLF